MEGQWICLTISSSFHRGDKDAVASEVQRIFGEDLREARIVCDEAMEQTGEFFTLVCCTNYFEHVNELKDSAAVLRVVPSYGDPAFLTPKDVESFSQSVEEEPPTEDFIYGDMVIIKDEVKPKGLQYLSGLYGLVVGYGKRPGWMKVYFRFETRSFEYIIASTSLKFCGNVLETLRVSPFNAPVKRVSLFSKDLAPKARRAVKNLVRRDTIHRKQRRELEKPYSRRR